MANNPIIITLKDLNLGGLSDSEYQGVEGSVSKLVGLDLHTTPGLVKVQQKLVKDSGVTVDEFVKNMVSCSDGSTYMFSSTSGKIWKRTSAGVYTLEATNANGACFGAHEFEGYVYYASASKLGRWQIGTAWSTRVDSCETFTNADTLYHPMIDKNQILYIGDGNLLAQVEGGVFAPDALDINAPYRISCIGPTGESLLACTTVASSVKKNKGYIWDTWSVSWAMDDDIYEDGINCFIPMDNAVLVQAGSKGNIYAHDGSAFSSLKKIPGDYSGTKKMIVYPDASLADDKLSCFGVSNVSGNPCLCGVYGFGGYSAGYPKILSLDYPISTGALANVEIGSITEIADGFLVTWKDSNTGGPTYGIDKIDFTAKYTGAYIEGRVYGLDRRVGKSVGIDIPYRSLPAGCDLVLTTYTNYGSPVTQTMVQDVDRNVYTLQVPILMATTFKFRVSFTVSGNTAPEIEGINLTFH